MDFQKIRERYDKTTSLLDKIFIVALTIIFLISFIIVRDIMILIMELIIVAILSIFLFRK